MTTRTCKRETCREQFVPRRSNQLYCNAWCQMAQSQRVYKRKAAVKARRLVMDRARRENVA